MKLQRVVVAFGQMFCCALVGGLTNAGSAQEPTEKLPVLVGNAPNWTYSRLASESDVIVIAKANTTKNIEWDETIAGDYSDDVVECVETRIEVLSELRGEATDQLDVVTITYKPNVLVLENSNFANVRVEKFVPNVATIVRSEDDVGFDVIGTATIVPEYLMFLRKRSDGRFEPVSGQRWGGESIRVLND